MTAVQRPVETLTHPFTGVEHPVRGDRRRGLQDGI